MNSHGFASANQASLLRLPLELRRNIYAYILPRTESFDLRFQRGDGELKQQREHNFTLVREIADRNGAWEMQKTLPSPDHEEGNEIVWRLGCTSLLSTCRQIHDECVHMIYGENTFVIHVSFDAIEFNMRWRTANNLTPGRRYLFLNHFSQRNLMKIRDYIVNVEHIDEYTGMIKFNYSGQGLTAGIQAKVQELVDLLAAVPKLHSLHVHLIDGAVSRIRFPSARVLPVHDANYYLASQSVLDPFTGVVGVRKARVTGVSETYATTLETSMTGTRGVPLG